jgi:hypothetical protein
VRPYLLASVLLATACASQQRASNVGGDGLDRAAATIALESIEPSACSEATGRGGAAQLVVVFAPEGNVTDASVVRGRGVPPEDLASDPRGKCLVERLRELRVPPFKGVPTRATRKLTLE